MEAIVKEAGGSSRPHIRTVALRGMLWLGGARIGGQALDQLFTIVLARLLLPRDFGLLAMAAVFTTLLRVFAQMGLSSAIIQRQKTDDEYLSTAFWANLASGAVLFALAAASSEFIGRFLNEPIAGPIAVILSLRFVIAAGSTTQYALMMRRMDFQVASVLAVRSRIVGGVIGVGMAFAGMGFWSLVGQALAITAADTVLVYRAVGWRPKLVFSWPKFVDLWAFGSPLLLSRLLGYGVRNIDNLLVGRYLGAGALGFYAFGYTLFLRPLTELGHIVDRVMFSLLSRMQDDTHRLKRGFLLATRYVAMIGMPMMVGLSLVASLLVETVFGAKWLPSAPILSILALAGFLQFMTMLVPSGLRAAGRPDLQLRWSFLAAVLYLPAFVIGLRWGIVGVATGYLAATCVLTPIQYGFVARVTRVKAGELWEAVYPSIVGSVVMAAVVGSTAWILPMADLPKILNLVLLVVLGAVVYGSVMWIVHRQAVLELMTVVRQSLPSSMPQAS